MPRLTQIKETKKGRLALFFDGEFAFSLDENTFADAGLHQDDDLEEWQIEELRKNKVKVNGFGYQGKLLADILEEDLMEAAA